ncbi:efflux RND transporter periplasmic adaptor subunit [Halobacillus salinarum]|uniref:Efflux RND transporter periplasmic adaptor subunit n=1 Tax=Halobacillus salinarum TaxID=2932257 RepID=A0ABY4ELB8_9BACI|nr:efflux RND transporter periplasmic adaptor subunit [Halobacillus salinarum]UOQ44372.1 efflux RND transporter periplasmic adaptor subunit [Halobacillus salinarum]
MKRTNYKGRIIGIAIVAFITANALLIYFDDNDEVDRKSYINQWSKSITYDLYNTLDTKGVLAADASNSVYFDKQTGAFQEFLIQEGDQVEEGDDLYTYEVSDYTQQQTELESRLDQLEEEKEAIQSYIDEVENIDIPESESSSAYSGAFGTSPGGEFSSTADSNSTTNTNENSNDSKQDATATAKFNKQEAVAEKELELSQKEAMISMVEEQLDELEETGQTITVKSPFTGTVTHISKDLSDPLLTLKSSNLLIEGKFDEKERKKVEQDMMADINIPDLELQLTGTLASVRDFPNKTEVYGSSLYPFTVTLDEQNKDLLPGYHADVEVITAQAEDAVTAMEDVLITKKNLYAWVMNDEGVLERRTIETGIKENGLVEIKKGLKPGEWLAYTPKDEFRRQAGFITPIKMRELYVQELFDIDTKTIKTYGLLGLFAR